MKQNKWWIIPIAIALICGSCQGKKDGIIGKWKHAPTGQEYLFKDADNLIWILHVGSNTDSIMLSYHIDYSHDPYTIEVKGFINPPLSGQTLYGIARINKQKELELTFEPGTDPTVRPTQFDPKRTKVFTQIAK